MTVDVGDIVRCVISFSAPAASVAQMVFYFECQGESVPDVDALDDLRDYFAANHLAEWDDLAADSAQAFLFEADIINNDGTVKRQIGSDAIAVNGLDTFTVLPAGTAAYLQVDSEANKAKGRKYIPFLTEGQVADGLWNVTALLKIAAFLLDYQTSIPSTGSTIFVPGVLSRVLLAFQEFVGSGYFSDIPAYQRRRKPNVGS